MNTILISLVTKLLAFKIAGLIFLLNIGINSETLMNFCENNTESIMCPTFKLPKGFTKCKGDVRQFPLSEPVKDLIVNIINEIRNTVAKGNMWLKLHGKNVTLPQASSMTVMQWDDDLAVAASKKVNTCQADNYPSESIRFGIHQAMGIHPLINETGEEHMKFIFLRTFRAEGSFFNISLLENYPMYEEYDFFTVLAHHRSLFIGCAMIEQTHGSYWKNRRYNLAFKLRVACYLAPSEKEKNNTLYKQGAPCTACPFLNKGYKCDAFYKSLCARPNWTLSDSRTQDANLLTGFDKETTPTSTTTTSTTTTSATTTSTITTSTTTTSTTTTSTTPTSTMTTSTTTTSTTPTSTTTSSTTTTSTTTTSTTTTSTTTILNSSPEIQSEDPVPTFGDDYYSDEDELTTTKSGQSGGPDGTSRSPMLVPSRYLPIIICVTFLSLNIFME